MTCLVYYLLSHFLLLRVTDIYFDTDLENQYYLEKTWYEQFGFHFFFEKPEGKNVMVIKHPWFLFGLDLTQLFQDAMLSERTLRLKRENQEAIFFFVPKDKSELLDKPSQLDRRCSSRTLGRGMITFDMGDYDKCLDVASFVRTYQTNTGMLIGSIEEIAYRQGILSDEMIGEIADAVPYGEYLKRLQVKHKSVAE